MQRQLLDDVAADAIGGRGRQGDGRRVAQQLAEIAQAGVVGAEIVSPLADAMGLVDRQQLRSHRRGPPRGTARCETAPAPRRPAGTARPPCWSSRAYCSAIGRRAVDERDRQPERLELIDLVLHQGDQRRDDQRQAVEDHGRQLVAEAFSAAGGHDAEAIPPRKHRRNHLFWPCRNDESPNRDRCDSRLSGGNSGIDRRTSQTGGRKCMERCSLEAL